MTPAVVAWVEITRQRQGLPARVEHDQVLDEIAAILTGAGGRVEGGVVDAAAS
jgi:hypothetical protein